MIARDGLSFPLVLKPSDRGGSGHGVGVHINLRSAAAIAEALMKSNVSQHSRQRLWHLEEMNHLNQSFRIITLDGRVIHVNRRCDPFLTGDGRQTATELLARDTAFRKQIGQSAMRAPAEWLARVGTPARGERVSLADAMGTGSGVIAEGFKRYVSHYHPSFDELACQVHRVLNGQLEDGQQMQRITGLDFMTNDITAPFQRGRIIEVNFCPGWETALGAWPGPRGACPTELFHRILDAPRSAAAGRPRCGGQHPMSSNVHASE
jgi:hypothetical protein